MPELCRRNHKLTVGFIHVGGDFGEKLYWCHARRCRQLQLVEDRLAHFLGDEGRRTVAMDAIGDIEISLIQ